MRGGSVEVLRNAVTKTHLREDASHQANGCINVAAPIQDIYKAFGTVIWIVRQGKKASCVVHIVRQLLLDD